jgi:hypothetical protein
MKKCFRCNQEKDISEFYVHKEMVDGHLGKCKECTKKDVTDSYYANHEKRKEYDRKRRPITKIRVKIRTEEELRKQKRANNIVEVAIKRGTLIKEACEVCGNIKVHAHHDNYDEPLLVRWLCPKHHIEHHNNNSKIWKLITDIF